MSSATAWTTTLLALISAGPAAAAWPPLGDGGLTICEAPGKPNLPSSAADGTGGAYFGWVDYREGPVRHVFVQHVDGSGAPLWPANGISIGSMPVAHEKIALAGDGQGGVIVIWRDFSADTAGNLYATHLSPTGVFLWGASGVPLSLGARHEITIAAASDGQGGAFVAWRDDRDSILTIRAQRLDADGNRLWPADGIVVAPSGTHQSNPRIAADGAGGVLIAWTDVRAGGNGFAQRLSGAGTVQWTPLGVQLSTSTLGVYVEEIAADGTGGMLASWQDHRSQNLWQQAFSQRVYADGSIAWTPDGVSLSGTTWPVLGTMILSDGQGGAIAAWHRYENNGWSAFLAQRLSASGDKLWAPPGIEAGRGFGGEGWTMAKMVSDDAGGAVFGWNSVSSGSAYSVFAQRVGPAGSPLWGSGGVVLAALLNVVWQVGLVPDGTGGVVASWVDSHGFVGTYSVAAERVAGNGTLDAPRERGFSIALTCVPTPARVRAGVDLRFARASDPSVVVRILDVTGRLVRSLDSSARTAGGIRWDGRDAEGAVCAPGLYLARVRADSLDARAKLVIID